MKHLFAIGLAALIAIPAMAQAYKPLSIPSFSSLSAANNTNNLGFDNATGGTAFNAVTLPRKLTDGLTLSHTFTCATVTLASVTFVYQGSVDGTNYHNIPGSALVAHIPASAASANNTNVCYTTNFSQAALQGWRYFRLAGGTNANAADITGVVITAGYWDP